MAKYTYTHSCGHTEIVALFGAESARRDRLAYFRTRPCAACAAAEARAAAADAGLPALKGSDKQIAWAETIRTKALAEADAVAGRVAALPCTNAAETEVVGVITDVVAQLRIQSAAGWWIDRRGDGARQMLSGLVKARTALDPKIADAARRVIERV